jgi:hypothetical protein
MKCRMFWTLVLCSCFASLALAQTTQPPANLVLYDNFDETFLSPAKWSPYGACFTWSVLECVREIQDDQLRLAVRSLGSTNSNQGNAYGPSELHFNSPAPIRSIATRLTVRQATVASCPANTDTQAVQNVISGNFFNSGSGNPNDDVQAFLDIEHGATDPQGHLEAIGFLHWQGQFFGGVDFGPLSVGQKVIAQLSWDQPNHQFILSWTDVATGKTSEAFMPYTMPDTTPAAAPDKFLGVRSFAPNCVGTQMMSAYVDTTFDRVWIGK